MRLDLALRFDYGSAIPWVTRLQHGTGLRAIAGPYVVVLHSDVRLRGEKFTTVSDFTVAAGQRVSFAMTHGMSHLPMPHVPEADAALDETDAGWTAWSARCLYQGEWRDVVQRSLLTLKALTYYPTGGIVAAPTTSLPELPGGERNWDYRFCWLRDATFTLLALMHAGYREEAQAWGTWLRRTVAGTPSQVQTLYGLAGERWLMEWEVPWLAGYGGARPVRIGNAASTQLQLDVYGELMDALYQETNLGLARPNASWDIQRHSGHAPGEDLGQAGREHLGSARRLAAFHLLQGDGLGRDGSRDPRRRAIQPARRGSISGVRCGSASTIRSAAKASTPRSKASCSTTAAMSWMRACCCCRWLASCRPTIRASRARSRRSSAS